jgi:hypothetical protein
LTIKKLNVDRALYERSNTAGSEVRGEKEKQTGACREQKVQKKKCMIDNTLREKRVKNPAIYLP